MQSAPSEADLAAAALAKLRHEPIAEKLVPAKTPLELNQTMAAGTCFIVTGSLHMAREIGDRLGIPYRACAFRHNGGDVYKGMTVNLLDAKRVQQELAKRTKAKQ